MKLHIGREAEADIKAAVEWYAEAGASLRIEFRLALDACFERISATPHLHPRVEGEVRRALLRRFPYAVFYIVEPSLATIVAVLHERRDPGEWKSRISR